MGGAPVLGTHPGSGGDTRGVGADTRGRRTDALMRGDTHGVPHPARYPAGTRARCPPRTAPSPRAPGAAPLRTAPRPLFPVPGLCGQSGGGGRRKTRSGAAERGCFPPHTPPAPLPLPPLPSPALGQFVPGFYCLVNICYRDAGEEQTNGRAAAGGVQTAGPAPSCIPSPGAAVGLGRPPRWRRMGWGAAGGLFPCAHGAGSRMGPHPGVRWEPRVRPRCEGARWEPSRAGHGRQPAAVREFLGLKARQDGRGSASTAWERRARSKPGVGAEQGGGGFGADEAPCAQLLPCRHGEA